VADGDSVCNDCPYRLSMEAMARENARLRAALVATLGKAQERRDGVLGRIHALTMSHEWFAALRALAMEPIDGPEPKDGRHG